VEYLKEHPDVYLAPPTKTTTVIVEEKPKSHHSKQGGLKEFFGLS